MRALLTPGLLFALILPVPQALAGPDRIAISMDDGAVSLHVDAPAGDVLTRLRQVAPVHLMLEGTLRRRVQLDIDGIGPEEAVHRIAEAAGLELEVFPGAADRGRAPLHVLRAPPEGEPEISGQGGLYRVLQAFLYPVVVLPDGEDSAGERELLGTLEAREGVSLVFSPKLRDRLYREYRLRRRTLERVLRHDGLPLRLPADLPLRNVRIYLDQSTNTYFGEVLFAAGSTHVGRVVFLVSPERQRIVRVTIARWDRVVIGPAGGAPVDSGSDGR